MIHTNEPYYYDADNDAGQDVKAWNRANRLAECDAVAPFVPELTTWLQGYASQYAHLPIAVVEVARAHAAGHVGLQALKMARLSLAPVLEATGRQVETRARAMRAEEAGTSIPESPIVRLHMLLCAVEATTNGYRGEPSYWDAPTGWAGEARNLVSRVK